MPDIPADGSLAIHIRRTYRIDITVTSFCLCYLDGAGVQCCIGGLCPGRYWRIWRRACRPM